MWLDELKQLKEGKRVYGSLYFHVSLIPSVLCLLSPKSRKQFSSLLKKAEKKINFSIVVIKKSEVQFVESNDWDSNFEPTVGDRLNYSDDSFNKTKGSLGNPLIFHRRHLFVDPDYKGFNIDDDKKRVEKWLKFSPDKSRMGRRVWWNEFLERNSLNV